MREPEEHYVYLFIHERPETGLPYNLEKYCCMENDLEYGLEIWDRLRPFQVEICMTNMHWIMTSTRRYLSPRTTRRSNGYAT